MRITELLSWESIELRAGPADKKEALDMAIALMAKSGKISDIDPVALNQLPSALELVPID